jgi:DNA-binding transcriptional LysR family regulator
VKANRPIPMATASATNPAETRLVVERGRVEPWDSRSEERGMVRVSIDTVFDKNELLRMSVHVLRTIELDALQIFKAVVDFGGVTRAAAQLHRVPSNVTTRLKQLEEGLGTKLFHRHSRKLLLSSEGHLLLAYAEQLLRLSSEAELALRSGKPRGKLRLGTLESTAAARLPPVLARYHRANPEVQIELVTGTTCALLEQVSRYAIEAAFVAERFESAGLEMMPVFRERLVVIAPKEITAIKKPGDIQGMTVIAFGVGCSYRRTLEEWLARSKITPERVLEFGSYHAIVACVAAGSGIALVPHSVVHALHAERDVSILPLPTQFTEATTFLVWPREHRSAALDALRRELAQENVGQHFAEVGALSPNTSARPRSGRDAAP